MVLVAAAAAATVETKTTINLFFLPPCPRHYVSFFSVGELVLGITSTPLGGS